MRRCAPTPTSLGPIRLAVTLVAAACLQAPSGANPAPTLADSPVFVVDDDGGAGVDFLDLPAAVAAVSDGDTLLVKPGTYSGFVLFDKGIDVIADLGGPVTCSGGPSVRQLAAGKRVTLRGLKIVDANEAGLQIKSCSGDVRVEACTVTGARGDGTFTDPRQHANGYAGVEIVNSPRVALERCTITGGEGDDYVPLLRIHGDGGPGVQVRDSNVALHGCAIAAGHGGSVADDDAAWSGAAGGIGLHVFSGEVMASGCAIAGGVGGMGGEDFDIFLGWSCGPGGPGGDAIGQEFGDPGPGDVYLRDCALTPGAGGAPYPSAACSFGPDGTSIAITAGTVTSFAGDAFAHVASSPVRDGGTASFALEGTPNAYAVLGISTAPSFVLDPFLEGTVLVDVGTVVLLYPGSLPPGGAKQFGVPVNLGIAAGQGLSLFTQSIFVVPPTFDLVVGAGSVLTVLDPNL